MMSNLLTENPLPGVSLIRPARSSRIRPRAPFSGSFGIATLSPDLISSSFLTFFENSPTGAIMPTLSTCTRLKPRCFVLKGQIGPVLEQIGVHVPAVDHLVQRDPV